MLTLNTNNNFLITLFFSKCEKKYMGNTERKIIYIENLKYSIHCTVNCGLQKLNRKFAPDNYKLERTSWPARGRCGTIKCK